MQEPAMLSDEPQRLETLRRLGLLDTPAEERFDRFTRLARRMFNVPIALITLIDSDRQWFKSAWGLDMTETPRRVSFCAHAILQQDLMVVEDAHEDPRFWDNPLVTGSPNIRFYAASPLIASNGHPLGTICVIDHQPRTFHDADGGLLRELGQIVVHEMEIEQWATLDELTQISNRRGFMMLAEKGLRLALRQAYPITLLYFDLDGFKQINDRWGHQAGDRALRRFATLMMETFRDADVCARLGGDEFVTLLPYTDAGQAVYALQRLRQAIDAANREQPDYRLDFSVGAVTHMPGEPVCDLESLLHSADTLMYRHKHRH